MIWQMGSGEACGTPSRGSWQCLRRQRFGDEYINDINIGGHGNKSVSTSCCVALFVACAHRPERPRGLQNAVYTEPG